ncbi:conserved hypothetical protein [Gloeothece citriformis PCC 7424]|uniref:Ubiquinone biosynthesis protein n=1 Tax=Gloeothece citriformis (strain PCC 7424) TaxID=65393 RepID=B7K884_GLOC7|nr:Coq4 family protein [Gloeothece citriformis]ACK69844.1 conserved hypothetical protein [Gloeothece citriformis PCC 7424]
MQILQPEDQHWENSVIESFLKIVKSVDGDFEAVTELSNTVSDPNSLDLIIEFLCRHPRGKQAFEEKFLLGEVNLQKLYQYPKNTLGYCYAAHMIENGLSPFETHEINNKYQYLSVHIRETHDLWHIVTGCNTNMIGEIQLESFYVAQLYASRFWLALIAKNLTKLVIYDIEKSTEYMDAITRGWIMAKQAEPLFGVQWNNLWETPLDEVRQSLNIILPDI